VFIRAKIRNRKRSASGTSWDFRVVESKRVPGRVTPLQRTVVSLGSLRSDGQRDAAHFRAKCLEKMKAAGVEPTARMHGQLDALLNKLSGSRQSMPTQTSQTVREPESLDALLARMRGAPPAAYRKPQGQRPQTPAAISFRKVPPPAAQSPKTQPPPPPS
jgi:hypothetical protein